MNGARRHGWRLMLVCLLGLLIAVIGVGRWMSVSYQTHLTCCIEDGTTGGGLGVARWATRMGFRVQAIKQPLWDGLGRLDSPTGNCVITAGDGPWSPWHEELEVEQWNSIRTWLARGNTLIVMA